MKFKQDKYSVKLLHKESGEEQQTECAVIRESTIETNVAGTLANLTQQFIAQQASNNYELMSVEFKSTEAYEPSDKDLKNYLANKTKQ